MGVGAGLYMCDVVVKSSRSLSHLLMSSCWHCRNATWQFTNDLRNTYDIFYDKYLVTNSQNTMIILRHILR